MKKAIAIIALSLALEAGFLLHVAIPGPDAAAIAAAAAQRAAEEAAGRVVSAPAPAARPARGS